MTRYRGLATLFGAGAAFADPEVSEFLEAERAFVLAKLHHPLSPALTAGLGWSSRAAPRSPSSKADCRA